MNILSLFSGAGGDSFGLEAAGMQVEMAVDIEKDCCKTFSHNLPETDVYTQDVRDISLVQNDFDGMISGISGGSPCQGSSRLNIRQIGKERNLLTFEIIRLAVESKAKWFLIENVPTFALKEKVLQAGKLAGYNMFAQVLNSGNFGIPQLRKRWFCVGFRHIENFEFPTPMKRIPTVRDALSLMVDSWGYAERSPNILEKLDELDKKPLVWVPLNGGNFSNAIAWELDKPAPCLTNPEKTYQKIVSIPGTIPQSLAALIQGFPNEWKFFGAKRSIAQQIVNACPPSLARAIGIKIMEVTK